MELFVLDDGWFGDEYPRANDNPGLGDRIVNPKRFPEHLGPLADNAGKSETDIRWDK